MVFVSLLWFFPRSVLTGMELVDVACRCCPQPFAQRPLACRFAKPILHVGVAEWFEGSALVHCPCMHGSAVVAATKPGILQSCRCSMTQQTESWIFCENKYNSAAEDSIFSSLR